MSGGATWLSQHTNEWHISILSFMGHTWDGQLKQKQELSSKTRNVNIAWIGWKERWQGQKCSEFALSL